MGTVLGLIVMAILVGIMVMIGKKSPTDVKKYEEFIEEGKQENRSGQNRKFKSVEESLESIARNIGLITFIIAVQFFGAIILVVIVFASLGIGLRNIF